jgi:uncharacterized membrane protein
MTVGQAILRFGPTIASDRRRIVMLRWVFLFGAAVVVIGIFLASLPPFAAYLDGALATDRSLTHRLRNNSGHAGIFFIHIYTGMIALALGTFQIYKPWRAAYPNLHRWLGRLYVTVVLISTVTSLGLSPRLSTFGTEYIRQLGAVLWASFTILGVIAIRNSDIESHRRWMSRSYAFAYMGITFFVLTGIGKISGVPLEYAYPFVIYSSLLLNLSVCELLIRSPQKPITSAQVSSA